MDTILITVLLTNSCGRTDKPYPAPADTCVFWCAAEVGMAMNKVLYRDIVNNTLHGWWPKEL